MESEHSRGVFLDVVMNSKKPPGSQPELKREESRATITNEVELESARRLTIEPMDDSDLLALANERSDKLPPPTFTSTLPAATPSTAPVLRPSRSIMGALEVMRSRMQLDDFSGALELARAILKRDDQNKEALLVAATCEESLERMYCARIGSLERAPRVLVTAEQIRWLSIDHRAGFLLSLMDGEVTFENLLDLSGMARLDALQLLSELLEHDIIAVK